MRVGKINIEEVVKHCEEVNRLIDAADEKLQEGDIVRDQILAESAMRVLRPVLRDMQEIEKQLRARFQKALYDPELRHIGGRVASACMDLNHHNDPRSIIEFMRAFVSGFNDASAKETLAHPEDRTYARGHRLGAQLSELDQ